MGHVDVGWAQTLARALLAEPLPRRWAHTRGVADRSASVRALLGDDADLVTAAAWLHDVGYAQPLVVVDFHPLDGARYLRDVEHADALLCRLVAHHTCALVEAEERGLDRDLATEFPEPPAHLSDALTWCDLTTGPDGEHVTPDDRLAEIHARYGEEHVVSRSIRRATPRLLAAAGRVTRALA